MKVDAQSSMLNLIKMTNLLFEISETSMFPKTFLKMNDELKNNVIKFLRAEIENEKSKLIDAIRGI